MKEKLTLDSAKYTLKECKKHGSTEHWLSQTSKGYFAYKCKKCNVEYQKRYEKKRPKRISLKKTLVETAGGKCIRCGYEKSIWSLSFHHRDPSLKEFGIGQGINRGYTLARLEEEAKKCDLLCGNCHMEIEEQLFLRVE